ncbi:hypothetical protein A2U01_0072955, partial [Trifolium medium]|nr:hypothetical protein [Trifolium medium]
YPPELTWSLEAFYLWRFIIVFRAVERLNRLTICSSLAALSVAFGLLLACGLALHRLLLKPFQIISFSSLF